MRTSMEFSIDLTAQELLASPAPAETVEVDDICDVDPLLRTGAFAAPPVNDEYSCSHDADESVEIELTCEQIDTLLGSVQAPAEGREEPEE